MDLQTHFDTLFASAKTIIAFGDTNLQLMMKLVGRSNAHT